jgi:UDP-N-acetylmuramoyl-tripeptide--D-alanyl-D-alanine ligase
VAVAGAAGKTTTKDLAAAALGRRYRVQATPGNRNGYIGVAQTILSMTAQDEVAVVEIGIDRRGAMTSHVELVQPTAAVLTALGPEHLEGLGELVDAVVEEAVLFRHVAARGGTLFVNLDDALIVEAVEGIEGGMRVGFTLADGGAAERIGVSRTYRGHREGGRVHVQGGACSFSLPAPLPGSHNARNLVAAVAVAEWLHVPCPDIVVGLAGFNPMPGRSEVRVLAGAEFICDFYNANQVSVAAALDLLTERRAETRGRAWACLGGIDELGALEVEVQRELADDLARAGVEHVVAIAPRMGNLLERLAERWPRVEAFGVADADAMAELILHRFAPGDVVLLKGSRSERLEQVWQRLELRAAADLPLTTDRHCRVTASDPGGIGSIA